VSFKILIFFQSSGRYLKVNGWGKNQIRSIILRLFRIGTFGCMREFHAK